MLLQCITVFLMLMGTKASDVGTSEDSCNYTSIMAEIEKLKEELADTKQQLNFKLYMETQNRKASIFIERQERVNKDSNLEGAIEIEGRIIKTKMNALEKKDGEQDKDLQDNIKDRKADISRMYDTLTKIIDDKTNYLNYTIGFESQGRKAIDGFIIKRLEVLENKI